MFSYNEGMETLFIIGLALIAVVILLQIQALRKAAGREMPDYESRLHVLGEQLERTERGVREELARNRTEAAHSAGESRDELTRSLTQLRQESATSTRSAREELTGSFTATVNAEMRVGALQETVTVTGESPMPTS